MKTSVTTDFVLGENLDTSNPVIEKNGITMNFILLFMIILIYRGFSACGKSGSPGKGEMFMFEPALCIGGSEKLEFVNKDSAKVHLSLLFQMTS